MPESHDFTDLTAAEAAEAAAQLVDPRAVVGGPAFEASTAARTWALFVGLGLVMVGNGLQGAVLGLRSASEGFGVGVTGLIMTFYFAGFLVGSRYAEHALRTVGHIRTFAALASTASSTALIHVVLVEPFTWAVMRFVFGLCMAGLYVVIESWLNELGTSATRGRLLAIYMVVTMAGISVGQLLLNVADASKFTLFALASVLVSLSLVPITLSAASTPPVFTSDPMPMRTLAALVPTGVACSFLNGVGLGALMGLSAVYAATTDMTAARISVFLSAPMVGAVVFQWPIGLISDRVPRRGVIAVTAATSAGFGTALIVVPAGSWSAIGLMFVLGGTAFPLYSLAIALTIDWVEPTQIVGSTAALVRVNAAGSIVGPLIAAGLMAIRPSLFFVLQVGPYLLILIYVLYRIIVKEAIPLDDQSTWQPFPARASAAAARLLPRSRSASGD